LKTKLSRVALAVGIGLGTYGLIAVSAEAADTLYFVNAPVLTGSSGLTPESATLSGIVDTGGTPGGTFTLGAGAALPWNSSLTVANTTSASETFSTEGLPQSGSNADVLIGGGSPSSVSNAGADNYSDVEFEYDTLADYTAAGNSPGPNTQYAPELDVPTTSGLSTASTSIGAFGIAAQNNTGNTPLRSGTTYVYWIVDQPGGTDAAETVNTFNPHAANASTTVNPSYACLPTAYIQANAYLSTLTATGKVSGGITSSGTAQTTAQSDIQGPCVYFYGNVSGSDNYDSPTGQFTTPKLGKLSISSVAKVKGRKGTVAITDKSEYKASGTLQLTNSSGSVLATAKFGLKPGASGVAALSLTRAGVAAAKKDQKGELNLTSNWDQPTVTKAIKLQAV
jgi:hypothetical protein